MNASVSRIAPPGRILLATDLSARCDRALDRASQLARQWQVPLLVVHVRQRSAGNSPASEGIPHWRHPPDSAAEVERLIRRDLRDEIAELAIHVGDGDPAEVILDTTRREGCGLIVLGAAGDSLGRQLFGSTVNRLIRRSPVSVLIVKNRPHGAYEHVLVGTDFTAESQHGLSIAASWFPDARFALMHALDIPYKSLWLHGARSEEFGRIESATIGAFLADAPLDDDMRQRVQPLIEYGHPEIKLLEYVLEERADLTVIGALRRGPVFHVLVEGTAQRIVRAVPSDILAVRASQG